MDQQLSPQNEAYLEQVVAGGIYPSKAAALDAAVAALREKNEEIPFVPDEHMEAVEEGLAEADAGRTFPVTPEFWASLRQRVLDAEARKNQSNA